MKRRRNIVVDEELLERARRTTGEKTYSGAITKALEGNVRRHKAVAAYKKFERLAHSDEGFFDPQYLAENAADADFRTRSARAEGWSEASWFSLTPASGSASSAAGST